MLWGQHANSLLPLPSSLALGDILCPAGLSIEEAEVPHELDEALALRMHEAMVRLQTMDVIFYEAQRQVLL